MMKKHLGLLLMLLLAGASAGAQTQPERKWHFEADLRYQHMLIWHHRGKSDEHVYDWSEGEFIDYNGKHSEWLYPGDSFFPNKFGGMGLQLMETYRLSNRWTVGLGAGLSIYHQLDFNTVPIFALGRWHPWLQHRHAYLYAEAGFLGCPGLNVGYGVSLKAGKRRRLSLKVGYDLQVQRTDFDFEGIVSYDGPHLGEPQWLRSKQTNYMHCLQTSIGIVF